MELPRVTAQELGRFLDTVANAQIPLRTVPDIGDILARLVRLANAKGSIGVIPDTSAE